MKKSKLFMIVASLLVLSLSLVACGGEKTDNKETAKEDVKQKEILLVGFDQSFPPMGFKGEDGEFTGFDLEVAKEVADKLGMEMKPVPIDWGAKDAELDTGNINCIWNGFTKTGREDKYTFSKSYMPNRQVIVVKEDSDIKDLNEVEGKILELQTESTADNALKAKEGFAEKLKDVVRVPENMTALNDLEQGSCDAVLMDEVVAKYNIAKGKKLRVLEEPLSDEEFAVGFKLGNEELRDKVDKALMELAEEGKLKEISEKWFQEDITTLK